MNKNKRVYGTITIDYTFDDTFPDSWDDDDIKDYVKKHLYDYIEDDGELNYISVDDEEDISYDDATCDERYDEMRLEELDD